MAAGFPEKTGPESGAVGVVGTVVAAGTAGPAGTVGPAGTADVVGTVGPAGRVVSSWGQS